MRIGFTGTQQGMTAWQLHQVRMLLLHAGASELHQSHQPESAS